MMIDSNGVFDHIFQTKLDSWVLIQRNFHEVFSQREIDLLYRSERVFKPSERVIVFLSFENRYASLGGLAAVASVLPVKLVENNEKVIFLTPFHSANSAVLKARDKGILKLKFSDAVFHLCNYEGVLNCYEDTSSVIPSFHLEIKNQFNAGENPYFYDDSDEKLLFDSLAFSAAVPYAMNRLGYTSNLIFHAHDWETALISITSKFAVISNLLDQARTILTLHNSFDAGVPDEFKMLFFNKLIPGYTVLQCSLPLLNGPLTTVSTPFAHELRHDPIQKGIFTDHLQRYFSFNPPVGIENGMFGEPICPFSDSAISKALKQNFNSILGQKQHFRERFIKQLDSSTDPAIIGKLTIEEGCSAPVFFMSGRLDVMQKGFDIIFHAFERLSRGSAKLFFCPSSASNTKNLSFFKECAERCSGDITIWPVRISNSQYQSFLQGSSFLLMPSFYEPFGAATEGLICGVPVIARGTGGLWVQINPCNQVNIPQFYGSIFSKKQSYALPTGILYREEYPDDLAQYKWRDIFNLPLESRIVNPLFCSMVDSAYNALLTAIELYKKPEEYAAMILNGIENVKSFSWDKTVSKYRKVFDIVCNRGI
jgi:glycogen synthase